MLARLPGKPPILLSLCLAALTLARPFSAAAKDVWIEVQSSHFKVVSNAGENQARKIADQFEQFREVFHNSFPKLRVDLGKPLVIFAVKNEDTLKLLLPGYWEVKGRMHPAGIFAPGEARHYVAVRTDIETDNPYQVVYHEYTHAIMNLNFQGLPIWLGEGLAEYFGNSTIHEKEVEIGKIPPSRLEVLQNSRLIPIDLLLQADASSPFYNEQNRASVFYAESWAIVHYLLMDPDARKRQLLSAFLMAWDASGNQVEAATNTFGDLRKFAKAMEEYARRPAFYVGHIQTTIRGNQKSYSSRNLSPAEVSAEESLFYLQTQRAQEARASAREALNAGPNIALAHEAAGLIAYREGDYATATMEFARSLELSPTSYVAYFFQAQARLRGGRAEFENLPEITGLLEKTLALNPQFAPAYATLANFYAVNSESGDKALAMAKKAIELEPGNLSYSTSYGYVLLNTGKVAAAKTYAARIQSAARTPQEQNLAAAFAHAVAAREQFSRGNGGGSEVTAAPRAEREGQSIEVKGESNDPPAASSNILPPAESPALNGPRRSVLDPQYHLEGKVIEAECKPGGEVKVILSINSVLMKFHAAALKAVEVTPAGKSLSADKPPCAAWKGQRAKVTFHSLPAGEFDGELSAIYFF